MKTTPVDIREKSLLWGVGVLALLAWLLPFIPLPAHYHDFADQRSGWGIPCVMDVLSNAPFALWGVWGLIALRQVRNLGAGQRQTAAFFFIGLIATALGSGYYHLAPDDARLGVDRLGMSVAFAGLMALSVATRVSERFAMPTAWGAMALGMVSVGIGSGGNMAPWVVFQGGGMVLVLALLRWPSLPGSLVISWLSIVLIYALAKVFELLDHEVFGWTGFISGHTLKHVVASFAALPVIYALAAWRRTRGGEGTQGPTAGGPRHGG